LSAGLTVELRHAEDKQNVGLASARGFNVVAVIGRREAREAKTGSLYLRWHLTGEYSDHSEVQCNKMLQLRL
jgi:hypothetical protein